MRHVRAGQVGHRAEVIRAIKVGDWKIHDLRSFAMSDFIGKSIRLIACADAPAASICTVFCHVFTVLSMVWGLIPRLNRIFCVKEGAAVCGETPHKDFDRPSPSESVVVDRVLIFVACLHVVMMFAERLPVVRVPEELRITTVRTDVIHDRRLDVPAFALALYAQRV